MLKDRFRQEEEKTETFDGVLMCSGHHSVPYLPEPWEGQEKFRGKVAHSLYYKDHRGGYCLDLKGWGC